ncbi:hypothetical protein ABT095_24890 [Kitasatospora sp. NPDC002227]|uniref:hypothetical protein n=1 Tax=Kitasatospora sp. NPDC002227 TaxID=3154773 RepID=UPI0033187DE2
MFTLLRGGVETVEDALGVAGREREALGGGPGQLSGLPRVEGQQLGDGQEQPQPQGRQGPQVDRRSAQARYGEPGGA